MKIILTLIISLIFLLGIVAGMFVFYATYTPSYEKNNITNPFSNNISINNSEIIIPPQEIIIEERHITYLLNEMGAYKLKSYLGETPKIETDVDNEKFNSEIIDGKIITKKGAIDNEDLAITTSKEELIMMAVSSKEYIQGSVSSGLTGIEMKAGYSTLFAKGYLNLYTEITGKSLTGSAIKIFSS